MKLKVESVGLEGSDEVDKEGVLGHESESDSVSPKKRTRLLNIAVEL